MSDNLIERAKKFIQSSGGPQRGPDLNKIASFCSAFCESEQRWVPVGDYPPKEPETYLVILEHNSGNRQHAISMFAGGWHANTRDYKVVFYKPLPQAPELT